MALTLTQQCTPETHPSSAVVPGFTDFAKIAPPQQLGNNGIGPVDYGAPLMEAFTNRWEHGC
jgi:hypothetical protein